MTTKAEAPAFDLATLKSLFTETLEEQMAPLREQVASLQAKVAEQDRQIPKFVPMANRKNPSGMPKTPAERLAGMVEGELRQGSRGDVPTSINGKRMDQGALAAMMRQYSPQFTPGQQIRIDPRAHRKNWKEGRVWAEILENSDNPDGEGVILEVAPFSHRGWMYHVRATGLTPAHGMVFDEHELLAV